MKKFILSSVFAFVALISAVTLSSFDMANVFEKKSNAQWNDGPCLSGNILQGRITGIGNGDLTLVCTGQFSCTNPGDNEPPAWQNFTSSTNIRASKNGNTSVNWDLQLCKRRWTTYTQNVSVTVYQNGVIVIPTQQVSLCQ